MLLDIIGEGISVARVKVENAPISIKEFIGGVLIIPALISELRDMGATTTVIAVGYNKNAITMVKQNDEVITHTSYETLVNKGEIYVQKYNKLPRLTEAEFYSLD